MFGLGGQELLLLAFVAAGAVVFAVVYLSNRSKKTDESE